MINNEKKKITHGRNSIVENQKFNQKKLSDIEKLNLQIASCGKRLDMLNGDILEEESTADREHSKILKAQDDFMNSNKSLRDLIFRNSNLTNEFKNKMQDVVKKMDHDQAKNKQNIEDLVDIEAWKTQSDASRAKAIIQKNSPTKKRAFDTGLSSSNATMNAMSRNYKSVDKTSENERYLVNYQTGPSDVYKSNIEPENLSSSESMNKLHDLESQMKNKIMAKLDLL